ncbi:MAG: serine hydrolase [FCB group bacterium]|nr:serine hydrolase [FCB group bacterium]
MNKTRTLFLIQLLLVFSCTGSTGDQTPFLPTASPEETGMNASILAKLTNDIRWGKLENIHSLLVIKNDQLVVEEYFGDYDRNRLHYTASITKSFASVLLGIAIDQGYFDGDIATVLERPVSDLFPDYAGLIGRDELKAGLKLKHILSMTAGFEWDEHTYPYTDRRNDCNRINRSRDPMRFLFSRKLIAPPGEEFYYNGGLSLAISYLIETYTGVSVREFAERNLFGPLGITDYRWDNVENGLTDTDGGLHLTPLDQAKLGYLFLHNGRWQGKQVVSEAWVTESTTMHVDNDDQPDYGYQWWGGDFYSRDTTYSMYFASGHGGQKVIVIPDYDLVVVIVQQVFDNQYGHLNFISILDNYILPALPQKPRLRKIAPPDTLNLDRYSGRYISDDETEFIDVEPGKGYLILTGSNGNRNDFRPVDEHTFEARILDLVTVRVTFETNANGWATALHSKFGFRNLYFRKNGSGTDIPSAPDEDSVTP